MLNQFSIKNITLQTLELGFAELIRLHYMMKTETMKYNYKTKIAQADGYKPGIIN